MDYYSKMARNLPAAAVVKFFEGNESAVSEFIADGSDDLGMDDSGDELENEDEWGDGGEWHPFDEGMETEAGFTDTYTNT